MIILSRALVCSVLVACASGCVGVATQDKSIASLYNCGGIPLSAEQTDSGKLSLNIEGNLIDVTLSSATSGMTYQNMAPPPKATFWSKGDEAKLEMDGKTYPKCQRVKNSLYIDTSNYRAIGNNPSWFATISDDELQLTTGKAEKTLVSRMPAPQMTLHGQFYSIKADNHVMAMTIKNKTCSDPVSNKYYPNEVSIIFDGEVYKGCGTNMIGALPMAAQPPAPPLPPVKPVKEKTSLAPAPTAPAPMPQAVIPAPAPITKKLWIAKSIDGKATLDSAPIALTFGEDGSLIGSGGCNSLAGSYSMAGKTLKIEPTMTSTMMACAADVMAQEKAFTETLLASTLVEQRDGTLIISTPHRKTITMALGAAAPIKK